MDVILHGTGTSSGVPNVSCLTDTTPCNTCWSTQTRPGKKNIRRNTGACFRIGDEVVVVDVGKTFLTSALEWFPKYGLRKIAAVILTHGHADAMNGLDDLRGWTLRGSIQSYIDVYLSRETFEEIKRAFPYLVAKEFATGGGDVPAFKYHFFEDGVTFTIRDLFTITPIAVHHGRWFSTPIPSAVSAPSLGASIPTPPLTPPATPAEPVITPYIAFGFIVEAPSVNASVVYISDASYIPETTWATIFRPRPSSIIKPPAPASISLSNTKIASYDLLIVDCLRITNHTSHFGISEAVETARRLSPQRSYMVGFGHELTIAEWDVIARAMGNGGQVTQEDSHHMIPIPSVADSHPDEAPSHMIRKQWLEPGGGVSPDVVQRALEIVKPGEDVWIRPGFDGLRLLIQDGDISDLSQDYGDA